jgi:zinc transporter ZupT
MKTLILSSIITLIGFVAFYRLVKGISYMLVFSGAVLLSLAVLHLLPELYTQAPSYFSVFILLGFVFQLGLDFFSKGVEHGHSHVKHFQAFPYGIYVSLCLHALIEGIPIHVQPNAYFTAILIHKIPIVIVLATIFKELQLKPLKALLLVSFFSFSSALGTYLLSFLLFLQLDALLIQDIIHGLSALICGMLLHVSTTILMESDDKHTFSFYKFLVLCLGFFVSYLIFA